MKILFFVLFLGMLQPAIAADAFNEQELAALEKIKATVEGRLRYNQILLDILNEDGVENNEKVANFYRAVGVTQNQQSLASGHVEGVTRDIELLRSTHRIVEYGMTTLTNTTKYLTFLQMNITLTYMNLLDEHKKIHLAYSCNNNFHELDFYKKMRDYAKEDFRKPLNYNEVVESISMVNRSFQIRFANTSYDFFLEKYEEIKKKYASLTDKDIEQASFYCLTLDLSSLLDKLTSQRKNFQDKPFEMLDSYDTQKDFFDRYFWPETELRTFIHELGLEANKLLTALTVQLQEELLGESATEKTLSKAEIKRRNKEKGARFSVLVHDTASPEKKIAFSTKVVELTSSDRELKAELQQMAPPPIPNTTSEGNAKTCAISRVATKTLTRKKTTETYMRDEVDSIKLSHILRFSDALKILKNDFGATIEEGAIYTISLKGPNGVLTNIFCHNSHGAQDDKRWPAWRINMKKGLEAAGFDW